MARYPTDKEIETYIRNAAKARNIDPNVAVRVWTAEGRSAKPSEAWQSNAVFKKGKLKGTREKSYGPFQLFVNGGLGNRFIKDTGLRPDNWKNWAATVDYALDEVARDGWQQWYGARDNGISRWQGVKRGVSKPIGVSQVAMKMAETGNPETMVAEAEPLEDFVAPEGENIGALLASGNLIQDRPTSPLLEQPVMAYTNQAQPDTGQNAISNLLGIQSAQASDIPVAAPTPAVTRQALPDAPSPAEWRQQPTAGPVDQGRPTDIISPEMMMDQYSKYRGSYQPAPTPAPGIGIARDGSPIANAASRRQVNAAIDNQANPLAVQSSQAGPVRQAVDVNDVPLNVMDEHGGVAPPQPTTGDPIISNLLDLVPPTPTDPLKADAQAAVLGTGLLTPAVMGKPVASVTSPPKPMAGPPGTYPPGALPAAQGLTPPAPAGPPIPSAMDVWQGRADFGIDNTGGYELMRSPQGNVYRYSQKYDRTDILNPDGSYRGQIKGRIPNPAEREKGFDVPEVFKGMADRVKDNPIAGLLGRLNQGRQGIGGALGNLLQNALGGNNGYLGKNSYGVDLYGNPTGNVNQFPSQPVVQYNDGNAGRSREAAAAAVGSAGVPYSEEILNSSYGANPGLF